MSPFLIQAPELAAKPPEKGLIVDVGQGARYAKAHLPGAVHVDYARLVRANPPVMGLLADLNALTDLFANLGLTEDTFVIAYDDEGNGKASRLLWTLEVLGHTRWALLDGGLQAWMANQLPMTHEVPSVQRSDYQATLKGEAHLATKDYIASRLGQPDFALWDTRTLGEFEGFDVRAKRGGHIPGARHLEWTDAIQLSMNAPPYLKPAEELLALLAERGLTPDKEIVTYCQTHHRSSHSYVVLRTLGYERIRGYSGAWSDWGNDASTPVQRGA